MKLLDLFCGAGGCSCGYFRAGFTDILGVDINRQPRYPFNFIKADALKLLEAFIITGRINDFDLIHASPPCQAYSVTKSLTTKKHPDLVGKTRELLKRSEKPYVIENVPGSPLINPLMLCGTMFAELRVIRHRLFECNPIIWFPPAHCAHVGRASGAKTRGVRKDLKNFDYITVAGHDFIVKDGQEAMDLRYMRQKGLSQAIPPQYTEYIGKKIATMI